MNANVTCRDIFLSNIETRYPFWILMWTTRCEGGWELISPLRRRHPDRLDGEGSLESFHPLIFPKYLNKLTLQIFRFLVKLKTLETRIFQRYGLKT